jgi:hypothetical protein
LIGQGTEITMQKELDMRVAAAVVVVVLAVVGWFAWRTFGPQPATPIPGGMPAGLSGPPGAPNMPGSVDSLARQKMAPPNLK